MKVFLLGLRDGWNEPLDLSSGMSFNDPKLDTTYDRGVNFGQLLRAPRSSQYVIGWKQRNAD